MLTAVTIRPGFRYLVLFMLMVAIGIHPTEKAAAAGSKAVKTVTVIGTGNIAKGGISTAREEAIANSLISAVKTAAADLLPMGTLVAHFPTLNQILFENPAQFIQAYKVLGEYKHDRKYRVLVQATVQVEKVVGQLAGVGIIKKESAMPGILFFITEQNPETASPQYWWSGEDQRFLVTSGEKALGEIMRKKGFAVVDHGSTTSSARIDPIIRKPNLSNTEAAEIGTRLKADVVVIGISTARDTLNTMGGDRKSFKGTITARAVLTDTSEVIASTVQSAAAVNVDDTEGGRAAITAAGKLAAEQLAIEMTSVWRKNSAGKQTVEITVTGTRNLAGFVKLRKIVSTTSGVNRIQVREIRGNQATILANYPGSADELADELMHNDFESFGINISDISPGRLEIEIMSQEKTAAPVIDD